MGDNTKETMKDLYAQYDVKTISTGDVIVGEVIDVDSKRVFVNINYAFDGIVEREDLTFSNEDPTNVINKGDKIEVSVLTPNNGEGYVLLSRNRVLSANERKELKKAFKDNSNIKVFVKEVIKGGLAAYYGNTRVFIPASLAANRKIDLSTLVNKELEIRLQELDFKNRKVLGSRRIIEEEIYNENQEKLWSSVSEGEKRTGVVKKIIKVGAIVDIGGLTGLIYIDDLAWGRVKKVEDIVNVGDKVEVYVSSVNKEDKKISLILKDLDKEPWTVYGNSIKENDVMEGKVIKFIKVGAFVELYPGIEGLVHISEIDDEEVKNPSDVLKIGQTVKVKVLSVKAEDKRISLSIKETKEKSKEYLQYNDSDEGVSLGDLFSGLLNK